MTMKHLGGWESLDCDLRGHTTGHLLSAMAYLQMKEKADSLVQGLAQVQRQYGTGYLSAYGEGLIDRNIAGKSVWAPFYTLHKILQGLIDQYSMCGNETALEVAKGMGNWAYNKLSPLSEETRGMIDAARIAAMKKGAILINVARGAVTDEAVLAAAIAEGRIGGLGVDVFSTEPFGTDHPFYAIRDLENVCLTPHMAWGAFEARSRCLAEVAENVKAFLRGERRNRVDR